MSLDELSFELSSSTQTKRSPSHEYERQFVTLKMVNDLKKEKTQYENEKVKLRSKIVRMRQLCAKRKQTISNVLKESRDKQIIQTASTSTLQNLKKSVDSLKNARNQNLKDLENIKKSDSFWRASELEVEIRSLFQEQTRLQEEVRKLVVSMRENRENLDYMYNVIASVPDVQDDIESCNEKIVELNNKLLTYRKGKQKEERQKLNRCSSEDLKKQINDLDMKISIEKLSTKKCDESCNTAIDELDEIIQAMILQIRNKMIHDKSQLGIQQNH